MIGLKIFLSFVITARIVTECRWVFSKSPEAFLEMYIKHLKNANDGTAASRFASFLMTLTWLSAIWVIWD